jgi:hypothetical protein
VIAMGRFAAGSMSATRSASATDGRSLGVGGTFRMRIGAQGAAIISSGMSR